MSNATIIGSASEFNGVTTFKSQPVITSAILANTDSSTNIATTAWSNAFWTYVKTLSNTFSGATTIINSDTTNIGTQNLTAAGRVNIATGTNVYNAEVYVGNSTLTRIHLNAKDIKINHETNYDSNINIGSNTFGITNILGTTNIGTTSTSTGTITIGNSSNTTSIKSNITDIGTQNLTATGGVNIASGTNNAVGSYAQMGHNSLTNLYLRAAFIQINDNNSTGSINIGSSYSTTIIYGTTNIVTSGSSNIVIGNSGNTTSINSNIANIATGGLSATGKVNIATGTNAVGSEVNIGTATGLSRLSLRGNHVNIGSGGLPATARVNIATETNAADTEILIGSTTLTKCFIRANDVNINHTVGGSIYMGTDTAGSTNILGSVNIGTSSANTGNITIGNGGATGYTEIASKGISIGKLMGTGGYISIGSEATSGDINLGSANLNNVNIIGKNTNIGSNTTGTTNILGDINIGRYITTGNINIGGDAVLNGYVVTGGANVALNYVRGKEVYLNDGSASYPNNGNVTIGNTLGTGNITINKPLTIGYTPSFSSSSQIGWSGSIFPGGELINNVNHVYVFGENNNVILNGVFSVTCQSYATINGSINSLISYNFEIGTYGVSAGARIYFVPTVTFSFNNKQETLSFIYTKPSQGGNLYGGISVYAGGFQQQTASPASYGMNFKYTRIA